MRATIAKYYTNSTDLLSFYLENSTVDFDIQFYHFLRVMMLVVGTLVKMTVAVLMMVVMIEFALMMVMLMVMPVLFQW